MATYCDVEDLLLGSNMPTPTGASKFVTQACDEIDSVIGFKYATPVVVDDSPESRPTTLLLKKIAIWLASGRLILAQANGAEDDQIQQYGRYLVEQALAALNAIGDGTIVLPGAPPATEGTTFPTGPQITNVDETSQVEDFTAVFGNPAQMVVTRQYVPSGFPYTW